jgi:hypothetical protein
MDEELKAAYCRDVEQPLAEAIKEMMKRRDRRLLGTMVQTLLAYPDYPLGWSPVGYLKAGQFIIVAQPPNLAGDIVRPKDIARLSGLPLTGVARIIGGRVRGRATSAE